MRNANIESQISQLENELMKRTNVSPELTGVILIGLTNRTNTGALATTLGRSPLDPPITRHIQPFKAIARQIMESKGIKASTPLTFLKDRIELLPGINLIKETIGPNSENPAEWVDSLKILLDKGIDAKKIVFIPTFRDPIDTISSWKFMWGWEWKNFPFDSFNKSFQLVSEKNDFSRKMGISVVPYIHEFIRDFDRFTVIKRMCKTIGIPFSPSMVQWENTNSSKDFVDPYFEGNMVKYDEPPERWIRGVLSSEHGGRGGLIWKPNGPKLQMSAEDERFVRNNIQPSIEIHNHFVDVARKLLCL